jgi:transcriptional regulator with XRE-family HTH domain
VELGQKIRQAWLDAGLSQRQLCGEEITRNMLSLIEHGTARPSMKTLKLLARKLGKPVSYFLEENAQDSSLLITSADALRQAEEALTAGKEIYAAQLLEQVTSPLLLREKLLLSARLPGADVESICRELPSLDEELLLRAEAALAQKLHERCGSLLMAVENQAHPGVLLLGGKLAMAKGEWSEATAYLTRIEEDFPEVIPLLEACFREMGDFKQAYEYACKQRR